MKNQLTVGQLIAVLSQLPEDSPVYKAESERAWPIMTDSGQMPPPGFSRLELRVWPRINGAALVIGDASFLELTLRKSFRVNMERLVPDMELPAPPEPSEIIEALELSSWPFAVRVLQGKEEVGYKDEWEGIWQDLFGPLPEWANVTEEGEGDEDDEDD